MKTFRLACFYSFHLIVAVFAGLLIIAPLASVNAQEVAFKDLDRRLNAIEGEQLDHRVTVIETTLMDILAGLKHLDDQGPWHQGATVGTGLLIAERVYVAVKRKNKEAEK